MVGFIDGVRRAEAGDRAVVTSILAAAFREGPVAEWLVEAAGMRPVVFDTIAQAEFGPAVEQGTIDVAPHGVGAAVWYPDLSLAHAADASAYQAWVTVLGIDLALRIEALDDAMRRLLAPGLGAALLAYLGVMPAWQGQGIGSALLRHRHGVWDADGVDTVLVATSERAMRLYIRHGYAITEKAQLPDGPTLYAMGRPACTYSLTHPAGRGTGGVGVWVG